VKPLKMLFIMDFKDHESQGNWDAEWKIAPMTSFSCQERPLFHFLSLVTKLGTLLSPTWGSHNIEDQSVNPGFTTWFRIIPRRKGNGFFLA
jgi:hypothetical protein